MGYNQHYLHHLVLDKVEGKMVAAACLLYFNRCKNKLGGCSRGWNSPTLECGGMEALQISCQWHLKYVGKNFLKKVHW